MEIFWSSIIGKTILSVQEKIGMNTIKINFTDNSSVMVDTENVGMGFSRPILINPEAYNP